MLKNFTTSKKIVLTFWIFHVLSLLLFFLALNIGYFFSWYHEQKQESLRDMDEKYSLFSMPESDMEVEEFREYLLEKDTLIIPHNGGEKICSESLGKKIHDDLSLIELSFFYKYDGKIYFIFSQHYDKIGEVRILFDTTPYVSAQIMILQISSIFILISTFFSLILWNSITKKSLVWLRNISEKSKNISLEKDGTRFELIGPEKDEIRILSQTLNHMLDTIEKQSSHLKQFTTDVSHEFKTPLMVMHSYLDVVEKKHNDPVIQDISANMKISIKRLNSLIESLLFLARIEENKSLIKTDTIDVFEYFFHKSQEFKNIFKQKQIYFSLHIDEKLNYNIEKTTFDILVSNLLQNACKFSKQGWEIRIEADEKSFSISDDGIGMTTENISHVYEKFYRVEKQSDGFWIGLFLVKRIIELYDWRIEIHSEVEKGTRFHIFIN